MQNSNVKPTTYPYLDFERASSVFATDFLK